MAHFPQLPVHGFNTPSRIEADIVNLAHEGTIPASSTARSSASKPDPQSRPRLDDDIAFMAMA